MFLVKIDDDLIRECGSLKTFNNRLRLEFKKIYLNKMKIT